MEAVIKLIGTGVGIGAGFVSTKLVNLIWEKATGHAIPSKEDAESQSFVQAITFAVVTAAVSTAISTATKKGTARAILRYNNTREDVS